MSNPAWGKETRKKLLDEDEDFGEPPINLEQGFAKIVVVDNIPVVSEEKYDKLKAVLTKIFTSIGAIETFHLPQDESKNTKGFAFVEFQNEEQAQNAITKIDGYRLDKNHVFKVTSFDDFAKYLGTPETYEEPKIPAYEPRENLRAWSVDERGVDQYYMKYGDNTEVVWNDLKAGENPETAVKREGWTETYCVWSPQGSYLATFHNEGIAVWGGSKWTKLQKFPHPGVSVIDFSPSEKYLLTASPLYEKNDNPNDPQCLIVWDIRTGQKLRGFTATTGKNIKESWPLFKWSFDDKYIARLSEDTISIYETPSMDLLEKKSLKIPGVKDFVWSPTEHLISYFVPDSNNKPASVVILEIPSRKEKRIKNLFSVSNCTMYWQNSGDFLAVQVVRHSKTKKSVYTDFELFRMREKDIPIDHMELKEPVIEFAWEPKGHKFAIIHGEAPRPSLTFYTMEGKLKSLQTLEKKPVNKLFWSPQGNFVVLAGLGGLNGVFEFYNTIDMESMATEEHFMATQVEWDPTGRYVSTVVSYWKHQLETGYNIYSFQGKLLKHVLRDKFYQLSWRPKPASLLPAERIAHIKKNIKEYEKDMKAEDKQKQNEERAKKRAKKVALRKDFQSIVALREKEYQEEEAARRELTHNAEDDADYEYREQWAEEVQEVTEIVINED